MKTQLSWQDRTTERDGVKPSINGIAYRPDGTQVIVAAGNRVQVYDASSGDLVQSLKGHKDTVYCVAYAKDGKRFASGGADKTVIIWNNKGEGILKYQHNDSIQCLAYNPVSQTLASATASDFGLWSAEQKSVSKHKVSSKVLSCAWTNDGQHLALGMFNGVISIRDQNGEEKVQIKRTAPIWCMAWNPSRDEPVDILAVGCWDQTLSFYQLSGRQVSKDRQLGFDPCCLNYFHNGEYIVMGGSDRKVSLWTKEGVRLVTIAEREEWVWAVAQRPKQNYVTLGSNDGHLSTHQLIFGTIHGLYQDQYAYRDFMTDVVVQHLLSEKKLRIKCRDYVKKIAIYKDRLAVQLSDRVIIYDLVNDDGSGSPSSAAGPSSIAAGSAAPAGGSSIAGSGSGEMQARVREKIHKKWDCNLLVLTSMHITLCLEKKLQLFNFSGEKVREWQLESVIRYIKVVGGPLGREGLLVGLKNGQVLKIFVDNPFPIPLVKLDASVRCLDLSSSRQKLAVVDENSNCLVYNIRTKELLFKETNAANSVAWNTEYEDMLCFSGNNMLSIKTGTFPVHQQKLQGFVVGFKGSKIFCLHFVAMSTIDVPQSASLYRYLEKKEFDNAYKIACLGVTDSDWRLLAMQALSNLNFGIARKCLIRVRDMKYIELLNKFEQERKQPGYDEQLFLAELMAFQGKYQEAAKLFLKAGHLEKAIDMFSDLRQWEEAKNFAASTDAINIKDLLRRQAQWAEEVGDWKGASEIYVAAGEFMRAITLMGERGWLDELMDVCRSLSKLETKALAQCASYFRKARHHQYAKEAYTKMGDSRALLSLHVEMQKWEDAFLMLEQQQSAVPQGDEAAAAAFATAASEVYLPYAEYLVVNDRFDEAQEAYKKANRPQEALHMIEQLAHNAVVERRFADASYYLWKLAMEELALSKRPGAHEDGDMMDADVQRHVQRFVELYERSELYYAYSYIVKYTEVPFTSMDPVNLCNISRFLLMHMSTSSSASAASFGGSGSLQTSGDSSTPLGISRLYILFALAKLGKQLGSFKLARFAYEKLQGLMIPRNLLDQIDLASIQIRSKPFTDKEDLLPVCFRCSASNPLLSGQGDACVNCRSPFIRSFYSFDHLPLVEFLLDDDVSDEEASKLFGTAAGRIGGGRRNRRRAGGSGGVFGDDDDEGNDDWRESHHSGDVQTLSFGAGAGGNGGHDDDASDDPFARQLTLHIEAGDTGPMRVSRDVLRTIRRDEVFIRKWSSPALRSQYFKNMVPEVGITLCSTCNHFFHEEDYEFEFLKKGCCCFCRSKSKQ